MKSALSLMLVASLVGSAPPVAAQARTESKSGWSRLRTLAPGTEVTLSVQGSQPVTRYVVQADESKLTVLNLSAPTLTAVARHALRDIASKHPDYFMSAAQGGTFLLDKNLRLTRDGVFIADQKVADFGQVVETIARTDVVEIAPISKHGHKVLWAVLSGVGVYLVIVAAAFAHPSG